MYFNTLIIIYHTNTNTRKKNNNNTLNMQVWKDSNMGETKFPFLQLLSHKKTKNKNNQITKLSL